MLRLLAAVLLGLLPLMAGGCKLIGPVQAVTRSSVTMHSSPVEDRGPLAEMPVIAGGAAGHKIALIDVDGLLLNTPLAGLGSVGENPVSVFREKLDQVAADPCYRAVVVRINSPGGGVTATDIMWRDLMDFKARTRLPVVACLMDMSTGGAYYLAVGADHIVAHPTTVVGGIGVILNLYNLQDAMLQFNIIGTPVKAGRHTDLGSPIRPMDEEAREILQSIADHYHVRFRDIVRAARPSLDPNDARLLDGRILTAGDALDRGMIDAIGYVDDAVNSARQLAGSPQATVVMLHRCNDRARTPYAVTPNSPMQTGILPLSIPGFERTQFPTFLYLWQPEPTYERRAAGR